MNFRVAIVVHLCLMLAQAACRSIQQDINEALNKTIQQLRTTDLKPLLDNLSIPGLFHSDSCPLLNVTELGAPEQRALTEVHISSFGCYILKASNETNLPLEMSKKLKSISQQLDGMLHGSARQDCSLPVRGQDYDLLHYVWCLLQRLDQRLHNATF